MNAWALVQQWNTELDHERKESLRRALAVHLNELLLTDFAALVQLLYRVDVPEGDVKTALRQNPGMDAGELLANLLLLRMQEKKKTLQTFCTPPESDEERW